MSRSASTVLRLLCLAVLLCAAAVHAETPDRIDDALAASRHQLDNVRQRMGAATSVQALSALRAEATTLESTNAALAAELAPEFADVEARLAELGTAPTTKGGEDADLTARRNAVAQQRAGLDAQLRLARLLTIESGQLGKQLDDLRRTRFEAQIGERTPSILARPFWADLGASWAHDRPLLQALATNVVAAFAAVAWWTWIATLVGIGGVFASLPWLRRLLMRFATDRLPHGRIRRSLLALGKVLINAGAVLLATRAIYWAALTGPDLKPAVETLLLNVGAAVTFGAFVGALGRALLSPSRPSWRLPPIPDALALGQRNDPFRLGLVVAVGWSLEGLAALVGADLSNTVAITCVFSLALSAVLMLSLRRAEKIRRTLLADPDATQLPPRPLWHLAMVIVVSCVNLVCVVALLTGYVALGSLVVKQLVWVVVVASTAWLVAAFVEDACLAWVAATGDADDEPKQAGGATAAPPAIRSQIAVLLSAVVRVFIVMVALVLMLGPLGQGPIELFHRADQLREGVAIGEMRILPGAVVQALIVLAIGIAVVRAARTWLLERYLPTTSLDVGMRLSTATLLGYAGMVFVVALALSALGIGIERVAWIASALSVGIGFGLQAVVQNFVSGVILLTERPVKVGDWVALGGVEGDIRRINVRATEIQMGDRSTVIVPNSEFITKVVRNVTHANPLGLVVLKLPMPLDTDAEQVRGLMLAAFAAHDDVLDDPPPNVQLDAIDGGNLVFSATASVGSPRQVGGVKSALLFDLLARLKGAGLALGHPPTLLLREPAPPTADPSGP